MTHMKPYQFISLIVYALNPSYKLLIKKLYKFQNGQCLHLPL